MKIRTIEELEDKLEQDLAWRKKEILCLKLLIESDLQNRRILLRAGIALLCAHFEGFIKNASNFYIIYVSHRRVKCSNIIHSLLAIKLKKEFEKISKTKKHSIHGALLEKFEKMKDEIFFIKYTEDNPILSTDSNPSSEILKDILESIGIESDIFDTKKQYIDRSLLSTRHKVVHGERYEINYDDFEIVFNIVLSLLDKYKDLIINSAENQAFLKNNIEVEYA